MSLLSPRPWKESLSGADESRIITAVNPQGYEAKRASELLNNWHIPVLSEGMPLEIRLSGRDFAYIPETAEFSDEKYRLEISSEENSCILYISGTRALHWGINTLAKLIINGPLPEGIIEDRPLFSSRGFIEGFYGKPWSREDRKEMLRFAARHNMNTYYYGPKDDAYHRDRWNELYDETSLEALLDVVKTCNACDIDFYYCIGPGISMEYSNPGHFEALMNKIVQIHSLGVQHFSLFLDDIPDKLQYETDSHQYKDLAEAHISLIKRFHDACKALDESIKISVCPYLYCGTGEEKYISELGRNIPQDIELLWTGRDICSREIRADQAAEFTRRTGHMPAYWDNYPVNDANMYNEMHLGPILDRDAELYRYSRSFIANGMEYCESGKIAYSTIADYLWNPEAYDPWSSWDNAIKELVGNRDAEYFIYFADNLLSSCLRCQNSPLMADELHKVRFMIKTKRIRAAQEALNAYTDKMSTCEKMLRRGLENSKLQSELSRWINKFYLCCSILRLCNEFLSSGNTALKEIIKDKMQSYLSDGTVLSDFCFQEFTDMLLECDLK